MKITTLMALALMFSLVVSSSFKKFDTNVCNEVKKKGMCKGQFRRYYYNSEKSKCQEFYYSGCYGNKNNFKTLEECVSLCEN